MSDEEAVSPVIGIILMVAVTVLLAVVIAAFVFGMASGITKTKSVAATARQIGSNIIVTWQGGPDNAMVSNYTIVVATGNSSPVNKTLQVPGNLVGNATTLTGYGTPYPDHTIVVGTFTDGSQQVILDTYL